MVDFCSQHELSGPSKTAVMFVHVNQIFTQPMPKPKVIHQPRTHQALRQGVLTLVNAIRPTLGPLPRRSVAQNLAKFELLDDGGVIARRIVQLADRQEDVGAMLLRQVLWQVNQQVGDGTATTAVLYESIYSEGLRYIAAGANPMRLRARLMEMLPRLSDRLLAQRQFVTGADRLKAIALSVCYDEEMADTLGRVFDAMGQYGQVDIRAGHGRGMEHQYVEGAYWKGGVQSKEMLCGTARRVAEMEDAAILITDMDIKEPRELVPLMQTALRCQISKLLLIVHSISDKGLSVVLDERLRAKINVAVVKIDSFVQDDLNQAQEDIAVLTGATPVLSAAGQSLDDVDESDFGYARWVWADDRNFGFAGGKGEPRSIRRQFGRLRQAHSNATDDEAGKRLLNRLGRLLGGLATVHAGGITDDDIKQRKELAERTVRALRSALAGGVIPGGGTALLGCQQELRHQAAQQDELEARAAGLILARAVEAPIRTLLANAGEEPSAILAQLQYGQAGHGFDVMKGEIVPMAEAGILDVAHVQKEALRRAVSSAALALTVDVLVLHRNPETMVEP